MRRIVPILALMLAIPGGAFPCSIFRYTVDGRTYFCGNEDWTARDPAINTYKAKGNDYGYVLFGWRSFLPRYVQAGINSKGLCFDWAAVPPQRYVRDNHKKDLTLDFTIEMLKKCATVAEAMDYIEGYNIDHFAEEHLMLADGRGNSCVVEYNHSRLRIIRDDSKAQFITNFHLSDPSLGWYPCDRYAKMEAFFKGDGNKENRLVQLLDGIHQEKQYPTVYSYVFDLNSMQITIFLNYNYRVKRTYALDELLERDSLLDISF
jgi:hypothetical protein